MNKLKFETFYTQYSKVETEVEQYAILKDFTLGLTLDELLLWNDFISNKIQKNMAKSIKRGLTPEDKLWFNEQFAKFDDLAASFKPNSKQATPNNL